MEEDEIIEHLAEHINTIKSLGDPMLLYRIVSSETKEEIDLNNAGKHYTLDTMYIDTHFLIDIGIDDELPLWVITAKVKKDDIDIPHMLATNIKYPSENEISIKEGSYVEIIDIKEFNFD